MRFSTASAAILAFATSVFAVDPTAGFDAFSTPSKNQDIAAGSTFDIKWEPSTVHPGAVSIVLLQGATPQLLVPGPTVASALDQTKGVFSWTVPKDTKSFATYGFSITLDSSAGAIFQYSEPFHITGLSASSSSASATGTTTIQLSTGPSYSASAMSSSSASASHTSSSVSASSTSSASASKSASTSASALVSTSASASGSSTVQTTLKPTASATTSSNAAGSASATSSSASTSATTNAGVANFAQGSFALFGGLAVALAL